MELARGALTAQLFELIRPQVKHRFGDAVAQLSDGPDGVDVSFKSGARERFDLVVSGEGLHSTTRALAFGPEASFSRYLGYCFAIVELPNTYGLRREAVVYNKPGKAAVLYSTNDGPRFTPSSRTGGHRRRRRRSRTRSDSGTPSRKPSQATAGRFPA